MIESLPDLLIRYEPDGRVQYVNRSLTELFGELREIPTRGGNAAEDGRQAESAYHRTVRAQASWVFQTGRAVTIEQPLERPAGDKVVQEIRLVPEFGADGQVKTVLAIARNMTPWKAAEQHLRAKERELEELACKDSLTGLANRIAFQRELRQRLEHLSGHGGRIALLTLGIDRFKAVNDTLGHCCGDQMLKECASRLVASVGDKGYVARLGGDEFGVILFHVADRCEALETAHALARDISRPMRIGTNNISISTSLGVAIGPDDSADEDELVRFSDIALYEAKPLGRNAACSFSCEMRDRFEKRFEAERLIAEGITLNQFSVVFQPKVELATGEIIGAEALCRWRHPQLGMISPEDFIPVAEETGLILDLGKLVLTKACQFAVICNSKRMLPILIAVNVSARQLAFEGFTGTLADCLHQTGCKAEWLELELTESNFLDDDQAIIRSMKAMSASGIRLSIDDFGTGYSSLSYLSRLPVNTLKIDKAFTCGMKTDPRQEVLVRAIITMAQGLGMLTVAEGIENEDVAKKLLMMGCDTGQGFYFHKPLSAEVLLEELRGRCSFEELGISFR
ncbi:MAG: EAL domain-containing protein [Rhodobacteraceae bacterium]|nr:EAL domain-containing protein [Paracoccaceae bacterium]